MIIHFGFNLWCVEKLKKCWNRCWFFILLINFLISSDAMLAYSWISERFQRSSLLTLVASFISLVYDLFLLLLTFYHCVWFFVHLMRPSVQKAKYTISNVMINELLCIEKTSMPRRNTTVFTNTSYKIKSSVWIVLPGEVRGGVLEVCSLLRLGVAGAGMIMLF